MHFKLNMIENESKTGVDTTIELDGTHKEIIQALSALLNSHKPLKEIIEDAVAFSKFDSLLDSLKAAMEKNDSK